MNTPGLIFRIILFAVLCLAGTTQWTTAATFAPPVDTALSYRYSRTVTAQSSEHYAMSMITYTIRLSVVDRNSRRTVCTFAIDSVLRTGPELNDTTVFPARGRVTFNGSGTVVEATIDEYLVQPSFDEQEFFLTNGLGDRDIFNRTTFFSIPTFADDTMAPGDTITFPREPDDDEDHRERTHTFRLADTSIAGRQASVYGKLSTEQNNAVYDQPLYTYYKNDDNTGDERLWWSEALHTALRYESVSGEFTIVSITGQLQMVENMYTETVVRMELVPVE